tara:strand:+ start:183 stop:335 length:153 start_codon:yes stop_codon:yes gene_type:complete
MFYGACRRRHNSAAIKVTIVNSNPHNPYIAHEPIKIKIDFQILLKENNIN